MKRFTTTLIPAALLLTGVTAAAFAQTPSIQAPATQAPATQAPATMAPSTMAPSTMAPAVSAPAAPSARTSAPAPHGTSAHVSAPRGTPAHVNDRIEAMRRRLQITAQQEPAWNAFAQTMRDNATATEQAYQDRAAHLQTMTAVENLHSFAKLEQSRAEGLEGLATSFDTLYGQLSDTQKHVADAMFARQGEHAGKHKK
jgi:hypothetical protein